MSAIDQLRAFGDAIGDLEGVAERAAQEAAPLVEKALRKNLAAGKDPYGNTWPQKKDGGRPLANAADHLHARAIDSYIEVSVEGPDAWHNEGAGGRPVRQVVPDVEIPDAVSDAIEQGAARAFDAIMKGGA